METKNLNDAIAYEVDVSVPFARRNWGGLLTDLNESFDLNGDNGYGLGYADMRRSGMSEKKAKSMVKAIVLYCRRRKIPVNDCKNKKSVLVSAGRCPTGYNES